jgi:hypothetical protein
LQQQAAIADGVDASVTKARKQAAVDRAHKGAASGVDPLTYMTKQDVADAGPQVVAAARRLAKSVRKGNPLVSSEKALRHFYDMAPSALINVPDVIIDGSLSEPDADKVKAIKQAEMQRLADPHKGLDVHKETTEWANTNWPKSDSSAIRTKSAFRIVIRDAVRRLEDTEKRRIRPDELEKLHLQYSKGVDSNTGWRKHFPDWVVAISDATITSNDPAVKAKITATQLDEEIKRQEAAGRPNLPIGVIRRIINGELDPETIPAQVKPPRAAPAPETRKKRPAARAVPEDFKIENLSSADRKFVEDAWKLIRKNNPQLPEFPERDAYHLVLDRAGRL